MSTVCSGCGEPPRQRPDGSEIALKRCTRCHIAWYHDADCQKAHYPQHRKVCRKQTTDTENKSTSQTKSTEKAMHKCWDTEMYRFEQLPGRGLGMLASCDIESGTFLPSTNPNEDFFDAIVPPVLLKDHRRTHCSYCFGKLHANSASTIKLSETERYCVFMCSSQCYEAVKPWIDVEVEAARQAHDVRIILPSAIFVFRMIYAVHTIKLAMTDITSMSVHQNPTSDSHLHSQAIHYTVCTLLRSSGGPYLSTSLDLVKAMIACISINSFSIYDDDYTVLGNGVFPPAHRINHSCYPHVLQCFICGVRGQAPRLQLRVGRPISKGVEICVSYIDTNQSLADRQQELKANYFFDCRCIKCLSEV
jgi:hypothetical protein